MTAEKLNAALLDGVERIADALEKRRPPAINVPELPAPVVNVAVPKVDVTVPDPVKTAWTFTVTKRDVTGRIQTFTATPQ